MSALSRLSRVAWTVRYLKASQIAGQVRHRVVRSFVRYGNASDGGVEAYPGCTWPKGVSFLPPGAQDNRADAIRKGALRFFNVEKRVGFPPRWDCPESPRLWQYNLHYFEWLWALDYEDAKITVLDWIEKHPPAREAVGWEPYPTSLRLMNWCAVFFSKCRETTEADHDFLHKLWVSVVHQGDWLMRHLETHQLGNHYLENGAALAFIGSCFAGEQAGKWFRRGCHILKAQIPEQIPPDGMHFELTPGYHCRVTHVLAMLVATGNDRLKALLAAPLARMMKALDIVCHPDGRISLLSDSAFGIYNEPDQLKSLCRKLLGDRSTELPASQGCFALPDAGYYGWRDLEGNYIICDFGKVGPDHIPGHGHADIFSFELSLRGHRVIVDSGVGDYDVSETRRYCRSTAAHNTVEVDGKDQCEMWAAFRVARRGYPRDIKWEPSATGFSISGWHDGYRRLSGRPVHSRRIEWGPRKGLVITDRITSASVVKAVSRLYLHPACKVTSLREGRVEIGFPGGCAEVVSTSKSLLEIEEGACFRQFGMRESIRVITAKGTGRDIQLGYLIHAT